MLTGRVQALLLALAFSLLPVISLSAFAGVSAADPIDMARAYARARYADMVEIAGRNEASIPQGYERIMEAILDGDFTVAKARWNQYSERDNENYYALWQPMLEAYGFLEQAHMWTPELLTRYADDILSSIPDGSIYFGGTDPGRFVISAYRDLADAPDIFVITQNALADQTYQAHMRERHGRRIRLPSPDESNRAFQQYVEDVRAGRIPPGAEVSVQDGRVSVHGVAGVMMINGILARMIFDANKDQHEFYVEESYVIHWMYPHLEPHGLIMRLHPEPVEFTPAMLKRDHAFWEARTRDLLDDPLFRENETARKTYSKLRSAIAGLYASRELYDDAERAFRQAIDLCPESPEAGFRLADLYITQHRYPDARAVIEAFYERVPSETRARDYLERIYEMEAKEVGVGEEEEEPGNEDPAPAR